MGAVLGQALSRRERLTNRLRDKSHCEVDPTPVRFGRPGWFAQHRWLEPAIGLALLLPIGLLYLISASTVGRTADVALGLVWLGFLATGLILRRLRPCTVLRFPAYALGAWLAVILIATR